MLYLCDLQLDHILSEMRWILVGMSFLATVLTHGQEKSAVDFVEHLLEVRIAEDTIWLSDKPSMEWVLQDTAMIHDSGIFDEADWRHIRSQLKHAETIRWKKGSLAKVHLIRWRRLRALFRRDNGWTKFHERYALCLPTISVPLFSLDGERCIQWFGVWCDGLNGRGAVTVYERKEGAWRVLRSYSQIVS